MEHVGKKITDIIARYSIIVFLSVQNFWIFYFIFTPLTIYPVYFILQTFVDAVLIKNIIVINTQYPIEIIDACIAGSAYYILAILNLSTLGIGIKTRIKMVLFAFGSLLIFNILRISVLSFIFLNSMPVFIAAHKFFWYFMSTAFVVAIWFFEVKLFKIKEIPIYSDLKFLHKHSMKGK